MRLQKSILKTRKYQMTKTINIWKYADTVTIEFGGAKQSIRAFVQPLHYRSPYRYYYHNDNMLNDGYKLMIYPIDVTISDEIISVDNQKYKVLKNDTYKHKGQALYKWAEIKEIK